MNPLLLDLALILIVAGLTTVVFKYLKQPLVLGYIVAGFLTGPYFEYIPTVKEVSSLDFWGEIGVVFLLFGLGLEFNIKKLIKVGSIGFTTVTAEVILMSIVGFSVGRLLGWSDISSIFLGGMLTISSTSIIIKAFDDLGLKSKKFAQNVFGVLVVEDIVAVLLLVVLSALAISSDISGTEMFYKILYLFLFLLLWFTGGIYIIPSIFRKIKFRVSDETLTVISLGLCLGMVAITEYSGFSSALGAFMMGSILSGTIYTDRIMGVYRFASEGSWTSMHLNEVDFGHIENETVWLTVFDRYTGGRFSKEINFHMAHIWLTEYRKTLEPRIRRRAGGYIRQLPLRERLLFNFTFAFFSVFGKTADRLFGFIKKRLLK